MRYLTGVGIRIIIQRDYFPSPTPSMGTISFTECFTKMLSKAPLFSFPIMLHFPFPSFCYQHPSFWIYLTDAGHSSHLTVITFVPATLL